MFLHSITLKNLLSFREVSLDLGELNVLIGPNASGKSNLIEAVSLLQAAPGDLAMAVRAGGGVREWIWKGDGRPGAVAGLECVAEIPRNSGLRLRYQLKFSGAGQSLVLVEERLEDCKASAGEPPPAPYFELHGGQIMLGVGTASGRRLTAVPVEDPSSSRSVLSALRHPSQLPEITQLARQFQSIRLYREWNLSLWGGPRSATSPALPTDFLSESGDNLALVLNRIERGDSFSRIEEYLVRLYERFHRLHIQIEGGTVQVVIKEKDLSAPITAVRLSDGTLRFLCLLTVLCHPDPPPLVCIEEPELGLHPDALRLVAEALLEASERMQLIVTTHSEALIDALSERPDVVVVCERGLDGSSRFRRLNPDELKAWLEDYTLGQLWRKGEIGGVRW